MGLEHFPSGQTLISYTLLKLQHTYTSLNRGSQYIFVYNRSHLSLKVLYWKPTHNSSVFMKVPSQTKISGQINIFATH